LFINYKSSFFLAYRTIEWQYDTTFKTVNNSSMYKYRSKL